jgi:hypothetical protein
MKFRFLPALIAAFLLVPFRATADDRKIPANAPPLTKQTRMEIIRVFTADLAYAHTIFPMGKQGLTVKDGVLSPGNEELQQMIMMWGAAVKPGDRLIISAVVIKPDRIRFEINGGPVRKKKWYQRIEVDGTMGQVPTGNQPDADTNMHGSFVDLVFEKYVPEMTANQLKELLHPALDFEAKTALEAYLETVPANVKAAIQQHKVLVGMDRDMVIFSKGRAPKKEREKDGDTEYEEWIYGDPPQQVEFVRFVGDEVVRVETMTVTGEKIVKTEKEVEVAAKPESPSQPADRPANAPTLRRPGEAPDAHDPASQTVRPNGGGQVPPPPPPIDNGQGAPPAEPTTP